MPKPTDDRLMRSLFIFGPLRKEDGTEELTERGLGGRREAGAKREPGAPGSDNLGLSLPGCPSPPLRRPSQHEAASSRCASCNHAASRSLEGPNAGRSVPRARRRRDGRRHESRLTTRVRIGWTDARRRGLDIHLLDRAIVASGSFFRTSGSESACVPWPVGEDLSSVPHVRSIRALTTPPPPRAFSAFVSLCAS